MDQSFPFDIRPTPPQPGPLDAATIAPTAGAPAGMGAPYVPAAPSGNAAPQDAAGGQPAGMGAPYTAPPPSNAPQPTQGEALVRGAASGATLGFAPAIEGLSGASGMDTSNALSDQEVDLPALGRAVASPFVGAYNMATGQPGATDAYNQARQDALDAQERAAAAYPKTYLAGEIGSSLALPLGAASGGATAAARVGKSALAGSIGGAGFGAGTATSEGESPLDVAKGAGGGAVAGGALGSGGAGALEVAGGLGRAVASAIRGHRDLDAEAARRIVGAQSADFKSEGPQFTPQQVAAAHQAGLPAAIVDTGGERTLALARSSANTSPEARRALGNLAAKRFETQPDRISRVVRDLGGGAHAAMDNEALQTAARKANAPAYKLAYQVSARRNPGGINISPELMASDSLPIAMQRAVPLGKDRSVVEGLGPFAPRVSFQNGALKIDRAGGAPVSPDLQFWDYTQRALSDMAEKAKRGGGLGAADAMTSLRRELLAELDKAAPEFKAARGQAAAFFKASDALEAGQNFVMQNADIDQARLALRGMNAAERELFARGFASKLADTVYGMRDRRNVLNSIAESPAARQKIALAMGPQRAGELEAELRAEEIVDRLRQALGNSTTARQLAEMGMAGGAVATFEGLKEHSFNPAHIIAVAFTVAAARHGAKVIDEKVARRVGEMLASKDPAILAKGLKIVASRPVLMNALRRASDITTRQLVNYLRPSGVAAATAALDDELFSLPSDHSEKLPGGDANYYQNDQGGNGP